MEPFGFSSTFGITINMEFWDWVLAQPSGDLIKIIYAIIGWVVLSLIFFYMASELWVVYRSKKASIEWNWVLLAVDVPPLCLQTPKAVEQIFAQLSGAKISPNIGAKYWLGKKQKWFSFEIISIEGYIQFLIRTESEFRDLVEASIYAQYPDAEITEVEDYVAEIPQKYPSETHELFGIEFGLAQQDAYPIRTYEEFEYNISKDAVFSDPMAAILENFSRVGHGEQVWLQIILEPSSNDWKEKGIKLIKELVTGKKEQGNTIINKIGDLPMSAMKQIFKLINSSLTGMPVEEVVEEKPPGKMTDLTPGAKGVVESIEDKISKIGFKTKMRLLYSARKEVFAPNKSLDGIAGALNQFFIISRNAIVPKYITKADYAFKNERMKMMKNKFYKSFSLRRMKSGVTPYILNIEELATVWHFPLPFVKTPLLQKSGAKRGEPPINLPFETSEMPLRPKMKTPASEEVKPPEPPPPELQYG